MPNRKGPLNSNLTLHLAPMEGVIDPLMRELLSHIGGYDIMATEFIRVTQSLLPSATFYKYSPELHFGGKTRSGVPVKIQLLGSHPQLMGENAHKAVELGAPGIDLNFGCPAKSVNRHDGGATLLKEPSRVFNVVQAVRKATPLHIPVSAKVRLGYDHKDFHREIALAVESGGAQCLTIHARTKLEGYAPPAHWEYIAEMKSVAKNILVVANGDIWTVEDLIRCQSLTGCEAFALGRSAMATPHLARMIKEDLNFSPTKNPHSHEALPTMLLKIIEVLDGLSPLSQTINSLPPVNSNHYHRFLISQYLRDFIRLAHSQMGEAYTLRRVKQWLRMIQIVHPWATDIFNQIRTLQPQQATFQ